MFDLLNMVLAFIVIGFVLTSVLIIVVRGLPNILQSFKMEEVIFAIGLSVQTATVSTAIALVLALPTAYALSKTPMPLKKAAQILVELPLSLPYIVLGLSLLLLFSTDFGKYLSRQGLDVVFSKKGIILAQIFVNLPFIIRMIKTAFDQVDVRLEYISTILGATKGECFFTITLPLSKNSVIGAVILAWSRGLGEFGATLMLAGATRMKTETLATSIYLNMAGGDLSGAMASAVILLSISVVAQVMVNGLNKSKVVGRVKRI